MGGESEVSEVAWSAQQPLGPQSGLGREGINLRGCTLPSCFHCFLHMDIYALTQGHIYSFLCASPLPGAARLGAHR